MINFTNICFFFCLRVPYFDSPACKIYFKEVAEIVNAGGPPDIQKLKLVMAKHGLIPAKG